MKKLVRGHLGRLVCVLSLISMMVPSFLLPITTRGYAEAVDSGRRTILLLPIACKVNNAPSSLAVLAMDHLRASLRLRPGVTVLDLSRNSGTLNRAKSRLADEVAQNLLMDSYDTAMNPKASDEERMNAAAVLMTALTDVDSAVFGSVDGYQFSSRNQGQREVRISAVSVSLDKDRNGKPKIDANGNVTPRRALVAANGKSKVRPAGQVSTELLDQEAIADASESLATKITGNQGASAVAGDNGTYTVPVPESEKKKSASRWVLPISVMAGVVLALAGGGGNNGGTPPPPEIPDLRPPEHLVTNATVVNGKLQIALTWETPKTTAKLIRYDIYRSEGAASIAPSRLAVLTAPKIGKIAIGHREERTMSAQNRGYKGIHRRVMSSRTPMALGDSPAGLPLKTIIISGTPAPQYTYTDETVQYGRTYTYLIYAIYSNGSSTPAMETKVLGELTPEVTTLTAQNLYGTILLNWSAPQGTTGSKFRVFRSTSASLAGVTEISADELLLKGFVEITPVEGVVWGQENSYQDYGATLDVNNYYLVVWYDQSNKASTGPYKITTAFPHIDIQVMTLTVKSKSDIDVTWIKDAIAKNYRLERTTTPAFEYTWEQVAEQTGQKFSDKDLQPGTRYYYRLKKEYMGWVAYGDMVSAMTFPDAPTFTATPTALDSRRVELNWTLVNGATYYIIQRAVNGATEYTQSMSTIVPADALTMPYIDNLDDLDVLVPTGASIKYRIIASNDLEARDKDGLPGTANKEATVLLFPEAVTALTITKITDNEIDLAWTAVPTAPSVKISYKIERTTDTANWPIVPEVAGQEGVTYADKLLTSSTTYYYRITATNASGSSVSQVFGPYATYPRPATILTPITVINSEQVKVSWMTMRGSTKYTLQRRFKVDDQWVNVTTVDTTDEGGKLQEVIDGLAPLTPLLPATTYVYRVMTSNQPDGLGSVSPEVEATTTNAPPLPPQFSRITILGENQLELNWMPSPLAVSYIIERSIDGETWPADPLVKDFVTTTYKYADAGLAKGNLYFYRIRAKNAGGTSEPSNVLSSRTFPGKPELIAKAVDGTTVNLSWTPIVNAVNYIVQKKDPELNAWLTLAVIPAGQETVKTDTACVPGNTYEYKVTASLTDRIEDGETSDPVTVVTKLDKPVIATITADTDTDISLTWDKVNGATGYRVERSNQATGPWTIVNANVTDTKITDTGLSASTKYYYRVTAISVPTGGDPMKPTAMSDASDVKDTTTKIGPKVLAYTSQLSPGKKGRIYFSNKASEKVSLEADTTTEYVIKGYKDEGKKILAVNAEVTLYTDKGTFATTGVNQVLGANKSSITGRLDTSGTMKVIFMGRPEDNAGYVVPDPDMELGPVKFSVSTYGEAPVRVDPATTADQPTLVGPPSEITFQQINSSPIPEGVPSYDEGKPVIFQNDTQPVSAIAKDAIGQVVMRGTPIWFTQSWEKLTNPSDLATPDYYHKVWKCANFSKTILQTDDNGMVSAGFSSQHSGLYTIRAFALKNSNFINVAALNRINSDETVGGLGTTIPDDVVACLLPGANGKAVEAMPRDVLCKTFVYYNRWTKVGDGPAARINCDGFDSTTIAFYANDYDNKRVLPGVYFKARPYRWISSTGVPPTTGVLEDKNKANLSNVYMVFDEHSISSMLVRGSKEVGILGIEFASGRASEDIYRYGEKDLVSLYGPDLIKIIDTPDQPAISITDLEGKAVTRIAGYLDRGTPNKTLRVTMRLKDTFGNIFPKSYRVKVSITDSTGIEYSIESLTDANGEFSFNFPPYPEMTRLSDTMDTNVYSLAFTVNGETEAMDDASKADFNVYKITVEHPNHGKVEPKAKDSGYLIMPFNEKATFNFSIFNENGGSMLPGYTINFVFKPIKGIDASIDKTSMDTTVTSVVSTTVDAGTKYGTATLKAYFDKSHNSLFNDATELMGDPGLLVFGLPTPAKEKIIVRTLSAAPDGSGQMLISWEDGSPYEDGYLIERSADDGKHWTKVNHNPAMNHTVPADTTSFVDTGLARGTDYLYRITAIRHVNEQFGEVTSVVSENVSGTTAPLASHWEKVEATSMDKIDLAWTTVPNVTDYYVERLQVYPPLEFEVWDKVGPGVFTTTSYTDIGRSANTTYRYRVTARIKLADKVTYITSEPTVSWDESTYAPFPAPVLFDIVIDPSNRPNLAWSPVAGNNGYEVQRSTSATTGFTDLAAVPKDQTNYQDLTAAAGTTYYYRVAAKDDATPKPNLSSYSNVESTASMAVPATPTGFKSVALTLPDSQTKVTLEWDTVGTNNYVLTRSTNGGAEVTLPEIIAVLPGTKQTYTDNVAPGNTYAYKLVAKVPNFSVMSNPTTAVTVTTVPADPAVPNYTSDEKSVTLTWTAVNGATSYIVERQTGPTTWTAVTPDPTTTTKVVTGLTANTPYTFRVKAKSAAGTSNPSPELVATTAPTIPTGFAVTNDGPGAVTVSWTPSMGATSYTVELFDPNANGGNGGWVSKPDVTIIPPSIALTGLTTGDQYKIRVCAKNEKGTSTAGISTSFIAP